MNSCLNCGNEVKNKYCSVSCQNTHQKRKPTKERLEKSKLTRSLKWNYFNVDCFQCNNEFKIKEYNVNKPKKDKYFCCQKCACTYSSNINKEYRLKKTSESCKKSEKVKNANKINCLKSKPKKVEKITSNCLHCSEPIEHRITESRKYHKDCWLKVSGGIKSGSSRGKNGWYKGFWCDSSYELAFVIYNLEHNIKFKRNTEGFDYTFNNIIRKFYPDFILDNTYVEIKNYRSEQTDAKINQFPYKIKILYKDDLTEILSYVRTKYGRNFIKLYDNYKETLPTRYQKNNTCSICSEPCRNKFCSQKCSSINRKKIR